MAFNQVEVSELLAQCRRRCCICYRFCGVKIETDHMKPKADGGSDHIDNAIPVCFECHAEIHAYNDNHPKGRKFRYEELLKHKEQWLDICKNSPESLIGASRETDVGPIQGLIDELRFNLAVSQKSQSNELGCSLRTEQFTRAINTGTIGILDGDVSEKVHQAYIAIGNVNSALTAMQYSPPTKVDWHYCVEEVKRAGRVARTKSEIQTHNSGRHG